MLSQFVFYTEGMFLSSFHNIMKRITILKRAQLKKAPTMCILLCERVNHRKSK